MCSNGVGVGAGAGVSDETNLQRARLASARPRRRRRRRLPTSKKGKISPESLANHETTSSSSRPAFAPLSGPPHPPSTARRSAVQRPRTLAAPRAKSPWEIWELWRGGSPWSRRRRSRRGGSFYWGAAAAAAAVVLLSLPSLGEREEKRSGQWKGKERKKKSES